MGKSSNLYVEFFANLPIQNDFLKYFFSPELLDVLPYFSGVVVNRIRRQLENKGLDANSTTTRRFTSLAFLYTSTRKFSSFFQIVESNNLSFLKNFSPTFFLIQFLRALLSTRYLFLFLVQEVQSPQKNIKLRKGSFNQNYNMKKTDFKKTPGLIIFIKFFLTTFNCGKFFDEAIINCFPVIGFFSGRECYDFFLSWRSLFFKTTNRISFINFSILNLFL